MKTNRISPLMALAVSSALMVSCGDSSPIIDDDQARTTSDLVLQPSITTVTPEQLDIAAKKTITIQGKNLDIAGEYQVLIDGMLASDVVVVDANTIEAVVPQGTKSGFVDVTLMAHAKVVSTAAQALEFTGTLPLSVHGLTPKSVEAGSSLAITLSGTGFDVASQIHVNGQLAETTFINESQLTFTVPASQPEDDEATVEVYSATTSVVSPIALRVGVTPIEVTSITPDSGENSGGEQVEIKGEGFVQGMEVYFGDIPAPLVAVKSSGSLMATVPVGSLGSVHVQVERFDEGVDSPSHTAFYANGFTYIEGRVGAGEAPRMVSAIAINNTQILVNFSEAMDDGAANLEHYNISGTNGYSVLNVVSAEFNGDVRNQVLLTTLPMAEVEYLVTVGGASDLAGYPMQQAERDNYFDRATFGGAGEVVDADSNLVDSDDDGLPDSQEQRGYYSVYTLASGEEVRVAVTSNPYSADTDGDGISDYEEKAMGLNARSKDTDNDTLPDADEDGIYLSDPLAQDTDGDGFDDFTEMALGTSLVLQDTDGDQFSDYQEVILQGRNPRVTDLPRPRIHIGSTTASLDVNVTETDNNGTTTTRTNTYDSVIVNTSSKEDTSHNESTRTWALGGSVHANVGAKYGAEAGISAEIGVEGHFNWEQIDSSVTGWAKFSESQSAYQESLNLEESSDASTSIERSVVGGRITTAVNFSSLSDVAFTLRNVELTLLKRDETELDGYVPVASMRAISEDLEINLGPLSNERGPVVFEAISAAG